MNFFPRQFHAECPFSVYLKVMSDGIEPETDGTNVKCEQKRNLKWSPSSRVRFLSTGIVAPTNEDIIRSHWIIHAVKCVPENQGAPRGLNHVRKQRKADLKRWAPSKTVAQPPVRNKSSFAFPSLRLEKIRFAFATILDPIKLPNLT